MAEGDGGSAAAILLSVVGEDEAAALVGELSPGEVASLCTAMAVLTTVGEAEIEAVLSDFIARARCQNAVASAGSRPVRAAIKRSLGPVRARAMLHGQGGETPHPVFAQLDWLPVEEVCDLVATEHPQIAAIVLGRVDAGIAARAVAALPADDQADLLHRIATLEPVGNAALDALSAAITRRTNATTEPRVDIGGSARVAAILNRSERPVADKSLKALSRIDKALAARIDDERVTFADVVGLPDKDLGAVVRSADAAVLARAMKGVERPIADRFLAAMSARAAQSLRDEIDELQSVSRSEVEAAQAVIVQVLRRLRDDGAIRADDGQVAYV